MFVRLVVCVVMTFYLVNYLPAQVCDGNLGDNIFTAGDFGSGADNILLINPMVAPGYLYETNPPPVDGFYTITNNTGAWPNLYDTWLAIPDNSSDPDGYMMVVNASFEPGLFYEQQVDDLCENTLYEFSADVINLIRQNVNDHIKPNVSFLIDGVIQYSTGEIAQSESWITHGFTFTTGPGQTSVLLSLQNNAPGGIGNDLALDNIAFRPCGPLAQILPETIESICEDGNPIVISATITGEQYPDPVIQWQISLDGENWEVIPGANDMDYTHEILTSGTYYYRYFLASSASSLSNSKCRVVSNIKMIEVVPKFWFITDTLCAGLIYLSGDQSYQETGIYVDSLVSSIGCDSIVTLDLTFMEDLGISAELIVNDPICAGGNSGSILVSNVENAYAPFEILLNSQVLTEGVPAADLNADTYLLTISDQYACTYETLITINDPTAFIVEVGPDQTVLLGSSVSVNPEANLPIVDFTWAPEIVDCPVDDCLDFSFIPTMSDTYVLTAFSELGCVSIDSLFIEVEDLRQVYIPNLFSPNDDGVNDYFMPLVGVPNVVGIERLRVFDRWGAIVFDALSVPPNEESSGWDGTYKGEKAANGVYVYVADILFLDGQVRQFSGDISLLR